jgi:hypothetical protein
MISKKWLAALTSDYFIRPFIGITISDVYVEMFLIAPLYNLTFLLKRNTKVFEPLLL